MEKIELIHYEKDVIQEVNFPVFLKFLKLPARLVIPIIRLLLHSVFKCPFSIEFNVVNFELTVSQLMLFE